MPLRSTLHGTELRGSTYVHIFFTKYILHDPQLVESTDVEPQKERAEGNATSGF